MREDVLKLARRNVVAAALWASLPSRSEISLPASIISANAEILLRAANPKRHFDLSNYGPKTIYRWHRDGFVMVSNMGNCRLYYRTPGITLRPVVKR